jgi:hypothetical protein
MARASGRRERTRDEEADVRRSSTLPAKALGLLSLAALAVALAACGSGDAATSAADADAKAETARVRLEQCLRENGLDVKSSAGGRRTFIRANDAKARAAMQKCAKYRRAAFGSITPEQRQAFQDAFTKFAACMRQHGVELPDPVAGGGPGGAPQARRGAGAGGGPRLDKASPKVQAANTACQDKLPKNGPGGGGIRLGGPAGAR